MRDGKNELSESEKVRYGRNMLIREWNGQNGQEILKRSSVLVIGAGGISSPMLYYLAAAGVGEIRVCDGDVVELSNLSRQILHNKKNVGMNKALSAKACLDGLNSDISIIAYPEDLTDDNVGDFANGCDLICCGADDRTNGGVFKTLDKYSFETKTVVSWGGAFYTGGFLTMIRPPYTPCISCLLDKNNEMSKAIEDGLVSTPKDRVLPKKGDDIAIVGAAAGVAGSIQAMEAIKYLMSNGDMLWGKMLDFQMGIKLDFKVYDINGVRRPNCPYCGTSG